ncbi:hypothetical protein BT69DRAFT_1378625 [Atractiella rhizophila]|nr:hypothetical protein BT69DRAFT_1378625 [Atractiella rhizophila]
MAELARQIIRIIEIVLMGGSVTAPFKTISELVDRFFFPDFPASALPQFYSILDRYIVINTPIIFSALLLAYIINRKISLTDYQGVELVIWRTSEVFNGKHAYENLILYRMFAWLTLWLGGYYKGAGYGIVIAASVKAQGTQMGLSSERFSRRPRSLSILFAIVLPLLYSATIIATHVWSNIVCNRSFEAYERVTKTLLLLQNTTDVNIQQSTFQLVTPLTELMELGTTCFMAKRVLFGSWAGWLVIVFFVGGYAFFIMAKTLKSQIRVLEQVLDGVCIPPAAEFHLHQLTRVTRLGD